jgi:hypothetical protein
VTTKFIGVFCEVRTKHLKLVTKHSRSISGGGPGRFPEPSDSKMWLIQGLSGQYTEVFFS